MNIDRTIIYHRYNLARTVLSQNIHKEPEAIYIKKGKYF